ncbi:flavodoxin family protein [Tuwongella immobilis]|uniref:Flavodoxin: Flavodoxin domain protein n=1 Tax=Tuwongella immobilis TaxID=692036 RepID=A0A6C2YMP3_9BACT|nr:flavodoxin family protein [Tuwongella immobilis]VIP02637.1 flavodoxin : Flavodoxin domain protein OS=Verrucomicrobiae bacterium DG1235 GN=VDG1235_4218 PE=4 SV=1 [Tuwongella immobilis]VTS01999.1 flavodoxin : Flavodoxin domain protein OS=Verrucomicrobiae bacterium DG1235 GN=VDG1235_4218 PE=4 SV=1 [Tuwongella immobilis]
MGKVLVLYHSATGNTAKMAKYVAEGASRIDGIEVRCLSVESATAEDVIWCDGMALGSPTNIGLLAWEMKRFWDVTLAPHWMKLDGKIGCAFSSAGGYGGGQELTCQSLMTVMLNYGFLVFGVTDYVAKATTAHYGAITVREPRETAHQDACRMLGQRLSEWVGYYVDGRAELHPGPKYASRNNGSE